MVTEGSGLYVDFSFFLGRFFPTCCGQGALQERKSVSVITAMSKAVIAVLLLILIMLNIVAVYLVPNTCQRPG